MEDAFILYVGKIPPTLLIKLLPFIFRHRHPSQGSVRPGQGSLQVLRGPRHRHLLRLRQLHAGRVRQEPPGELETQGRCHLLGHVAGIQSTDAEGSGASQISTVHTWQQLSSQLMTFLSVVFCLTLTLKKTFFNPTVVKFVMTFG